MSDKIFTISQLSKEFGVTPRTIRYYEDRGLLSPRRQGQARIFNGRDRVRLSLVLRGRRLGFTLEEMAEWLDLYDMADGGKNQLHVARENLDKRLVKLNEQRAAIDDAIGELLKAREEIDRRIHEMENPKDRRRTARSAGASVTEPARSE